MPKTKEPEVFTDKDFNKLYEAFTNRVIVDIEFTTDYHGGQPADDRGLAAFVKHHLGLEGDDAKKAIARIKKEELGEKDNLEGPEDELKEKEVYGVNKVRQDDKGFWIGDWQIKACLKCAASRLGLFQKKRGSKGDLAEMTRIVAVGESNKAEHRDRVHFFHPDGEVVSSYKEILGCISTPQGKKSISHHTQLVHRGARASFEIRYPGAKIAKVDILGILSSIGEIGLGSAKAFSAGKFKILRAELTEVEKNGKDKKKDDKK